MIQTNCLKCGAELIMHDGYGVCSKCGEIIGFDVSEENVEEPIKEEIAEPETVKETQEELEEITDEFDEPEVLEIAEVENTEEIEEEPETVEMLEFSDAPKKSKAPIIILIVVLLCALAVLAGFLISKVNTNVAENDIEETTPVSDVVSEIPEEEIKQEETVEIEEEEVEVEPLVEEPKKAPVKEVAPVKETVKKEDAIITQAPSISYRIRKTADDSSTQIGAFSDLERAKAFAQNHATDGYKVYDMYGNLVYQP